MDQLVNCSKCQSIPIDVLMMNCNHNLCVKCALNRIQTQHVAKSVTGRVYIQCEKCKARTNLDEESVAQLQKAKKGINKAQYIDKLTGQRTQTPINTARTKNKHIKNQQVQIKGQKNIANIPVTHQTQQKTIEHTKAQNLQSGRLTKTQKKQMRNSSKNREHGQCQIHKQQPVMYYCFTCKIHCFCAECVLLGKHNSHDVKVIKKAYAIVEQEFKEILQSTKKFINQLIDKNRFIANDINASKNRADTIKKTIEKGFDEVRQLIRQKQVQFMKLVDKQFTKILQTNHGVIKKNIENKLKQQQSFLLKLQNAAAYGQESVLNLLADEGRAMRQFVKNQSLSIPTPQSKLDDALSTYIGDVKKELQKIQLKQLQ